jgi:anthranilate phosphoribosyltransferase
MMPSMGIAAFIKEIGRGKEGARALSSEQAHELMSQVLAGSVTDLEVGAFCIAMRIKGETPDELAGFLRATQAHCLAPVSASPVVWLPSYNGARKLPNLTPLLATLLAQRGAPVLVHGPLAEPGRTCSKEIFDALGHAAPTDQAGIEAVWQRGHAAIVSTEALCPPLARLLAVRRVVGLRNPGHTVAKLLHALPASAAAQGEAPTSFRIVNHTHPEYAGVLGEFLQQSRADALLLRGTEGEPVADARRTPRMSVFLQGELRADLGVAQREGVLTQIPELPRDIDAASTARYIERVMADQLPVPEPIALQVECILRALQATRLDPAPAHDHAA